MRIEAYFEPDIGSVSNAKRFSFILLLTDGDVSARCMITPPNSAGLEVGPIMEWDAQFPEELVGELKHVLKEIAVDPLEEAEGFVLHGGAHGIKVGAAQHALSFEWSNLPASWVPLGDWLRRAIGILYPEYKRYI